MRHRSIMRYLSACITLFACAWTTIGYAQVTTRPPYSVKQDTSDRFAAPLDEVTLENTPYPTRDLYLYVPELNVDDRGNSVVVSQGFIGNSTDREAKFTTGFTDAQLAEGVDGLGFSSLSAPGDIPRPVKLDLPTQLPSDKSSGRSGYTISVWVKVPESSIPKVNPLVAWGRSSTLRSFMLYTLSYQKGAGELDTQPWDGRVHFSAPGLTGAKRYDTKNHKEPYLLRSNTRIDDNKWHHVALVFATEDNILSGSVSLFVDGQLEASALTTTRRLSSSSNARSSFGFNRVWAGDAPVLDEGYGNNGVGATFNSNVSMSQEPYVLLSDSTLDELFVYDRPLDKGEVRSLFTKVHRKLARIWPARSGDGSSYWARFGIDTTSYASRRFTNYTGKLPTYTPRTNSVSYMTGAGSRVDALYNFTLSAWVQLPQNDGRVFTLSGSTNNGQRLDPEMSNQSRLGFEIVTINGKRRLRATLYQVSQSTSSGTTHRITQRDSSKAHTGSGRWAFIAVSFDGSTTKLWLNGEEVASANNWSGVFVTTRDLETLFLGNIPRFAWATMSRRALPHDELMGLRSPGPAFWTKSDGKTDISSEGYLPFDWAGLRELFEEVPARVTSLEGVDNIYFNTYNQPFATAFNQFKPRNFGSNPNRHGPRALRVAGKGPLSGEAFSVMGELDLSPDVCDGYSCNSYPIKYFKPIKLVSRHAPGATASSTPSFEAELMCFRQKYCYAFMITPNAQGVMQPLIGGFNVENAEDLRFALTHDGDETNLYIDGKKVTLRREQSLPVDGWRFPGLGKSKPTNARDFWFGPLNDNFNYAYTWKTLRVYPRALGESEVTQIGLTCEQLGCSDANKTCLLKGAFGTEFYNSNLCLECEKGSVGTLGEGPQDQCLAVKNRFEPCSADAECGVGAYCAQHILTSGGATRSEFLCVPAYTSSTPTECAASCEEIGRMCENKSLTTLGGGGVQTYTCGRCLDYYEEQFTEVGANPNACRWVPVEEVGEPVSDENACISGRTFSGSETLYSVGISPSKATDSTRFYNDMYIIDPGETPYTNVTVNESTRTQSRCDGINCRECDTLNLKCNQPVDRATPPDGQTFCSNQCLDSYEKKWSLLSPQACKLLWEGFRKEGRYGITSRNAWYNNDLIGDHAVVASFLGQPRHPDPNKKGRRLQTIVDGRTVPLEVPRAEVLKRLLLKEGGDVLASDIPRLEAKGVGQQYLQMALARSEAIRTNSIQPLLGEVGFMQSAGRKSLALFKCADPNSAFADTSINSQVCVAKRNPDGSACPPPDELKRRPNEDKVKKGHAYCTSAYCARDTKVCVPGGNIVERNEGNEGRSSNQGKRNTSFSLNRINSTFVRAKKSAMGTTRTHEFELTNGLTATVLGSEWKMFLIEPSITTKTDGEGDITSTFTVFGVELESPEPTSGCTGGKWEDGSWEGSLSCQIATKPPKPGSPGELGVCFEPAEKALKKFTITQPFQVGPVPLAIQFGPTLEVCGALQAEVSDEGEFSVAIGPKFGAGVDVRAGLGAVNPDGNGLWAGVRGVITLLELGIPLGWVVKTEQREDDNDNPIADLFAIDYNAKISLDFTLLSGVLSIFVEASFEFVALSWDLELLEWVGFSFSKTLYEPNLGRLILDLQYNIADSTL